MSDNFYQKCIEVSGVSPEDCIMIGDNKLEDMYMANKNGMKTLWIKNPVTVNNLSNEPIAPTAELDLKDFSKLDELLLVM